MSGKPTPFLWFDDQAEDAAAFYTSVFPKSKITNVVSRPQGTPGPGAPGDVMTVEFELDGQQFTALNGGPEFRFSEAISFVITCADQDEVDRYWDRLSEGGEEGPCGWLKDRYGLSWQVVPKGIGELFRGPGGQQAMTAMLGMRKLDIAQLQAAADGRQPTAS